MSQVVKVDFKKRTLRCSSCGVTAEAACDCGVGYVRAGEFAASIVAEHPDWGDRRIAAEFGIPKDTVRRARPTGAFAPVEKRLSKNGKLYPAVAKPTQAKNAKRVFDRTSAWTDAEIEAATGTKIATEDEQRMGDFRGLAKAAALVTSLDVSGLTFTAQDIKAARAVIKAWTIMLHKLGG